MKMRITHATSLLSNVAANEVLAEVV